MIPKIIHYVWVGHNPKPKAVKLCIKTWKKHLQGYKIIEWNEDNFDIHQNKYLEQAYKAKKWAFVSDYIRAKVIYEYGGIYLDTDINLLDNFDRFLSNECFVGFETKNLPFTAVFGSIPHHPLIKQMLDYYDDHEFHFGRNGELAITNTVSVSNILINDYKCELNNKEQLLKNNVRIYPNYILCVPSKESVSIHVFLGSWTAFGKNWKRQLMTWARLHIRNRTEAQIYNWIMKLCNKEILY
ncbi:glycosyltransferase family 32 protein [Lactobacillus gallinarum]|uniref:glycosyltransferase family 32 protein n=1 Tax=Lactobacillus gallinarum TaxID=52242 RepID=UPI0024B1E3DB|nr:glycosyltransferase [Lactobacillus gallinarum]